MPTSRSTVGAFVAGALIGVPSTLGVVIGNQINRARRHGFLPLPEYDVDLRVSPPWVDGDVLSVAFLGDSLVAGVGAPLAEQSLPAQTAYRLAAHLGRPVHMRGHGVASSRIEHVIAEQVPELDHSVDLVVVLVGANDATRAANPREFGRRVDHLTTEASTRTGGAPVVFMGIPPLSTAPLLAWPLKGVAGLVGDALHLVQRRVSCSHPGARYIDVRSAVFQDFATMSRRLFSADGYHPNPAGYAVLAEAVASALADLLVEEFAQTTRHGGRGEGPGEAEWPAPSSAVHLPPTEHYEPGIPPPTLVDAA
ncbi:SGNH/GDSL hydrolase family protein [Euzebya tangerina]|uniref:SGNH/GDSL hydrolase family protein n=1 Tax=Euzebya tangerina TaxID=591198 RepID=UPI000E317977|nr:SGNH/GDSL hydrolase family protein [Euzebya tangerina]